MSGRGTRLRPEDPSYVGPYQLRALVQQALAASPELRPTARELVEALLHPDTDRRAMLHDEFERQPEMRTAVHQMRTRQPDRSPTTAVHRRPGSKALAATVVALALVLAGGVGIALRVGGDRWNTREKDKGSQTLVRPSGVLELADPLTDEGDWESSQVEGNQTYCRYAGNRLQIQNLPIGVRICQGPTLALRGTSPSR